MTDKHFLDAGYRKYPPSVIDPNGVKYCYQKRFREGRKTLYFITVNKWDMELPNGNAFSGFEYEVQLYQAGTHAALSLTFHREWTLPDVEAYVENLYNTGLFEPDEEE